jgi:DNA-binding LacI/PurR family transcriptional regulator
VGFNYIRLARFTIPPLTIEMMAVSERAKLAFKALIENAEQASLLPGRNEHTLTSNLVLRSSTAFASGRVLRSVDFKLQPADR